MDSKIHIIAEAGTNHNGDPKKAELLIDIAAEANADSVKFQVINPWGLYLPGEYEYGNYDIHEVIRLRHQTQLNDETYKSLNEYALSKSIQMTGSVFDESSLDLMCNFNPPYIKIASCDLNNIYFLEQVAERGKKVVLSTGMSSPQDIEKSLKAMTKNGFDQIVLLHCVSVYPCQPSQSNLSFVTFLKENFGFEVGFSDHTQSSIAACSALALGANWFEKHFTFDRTSIGLDHAYAMEKEPFKEYVADLRSIEQSLNTKKIKITDAERLTRRRARRSFYASKDLKAGHKITSADVLIVRPENEMQADEIYDLIGTTLTKDLKTNEPFNRSIIDV